MECEVISDATGDVCPACGSKGTLLALSRVLGDRDKVTRVWAIPTADNASEGHPSVKTAYSVEESDREPEPEPHV